MARKRARRHEGAGSITKYQTAQGHRWQAKLPHGLTDPETGKRSRGQFATRDDAQAWLDATIPAAKAVRGSEAGTVGEWLTAWLAGVKADNEPATHARYKRSVEAHVRPLLGEVQIRGLTRAAVAGWLDTLAARGVSAPERVRAGKYLRTALGVAVNRDLIPKNPAAGVKLPKLAKPEPVPLTLPQAKAVVAAAQARGYGVLYRVWLDAGFRPQEAFAVEWQDVAPDGSAVTVRRAWDDLAKRVKPTKTKDVRVIPLSAPARAALATLPRGADGAIVFPAPQAATKRAASSPTGSSQAGPDTHRPPC